MKASLEEAHSAKRAGGNPFGPSFLARLAADPKTRAFLSDPAFMSKLGMLQASGGLGAWLQPQAEGGRAAGARRESLWPGSALSQGALLPARGLRRACCCPRRRPTPATCPC
jgi:hypothetical protein